MSTLVTDDTSMFTLTPLMALLINGMLHHHWMPLCQAAAASNNTHTTTTLPASLTRCPLNSSQRDQFTSIQSQSRLSLAQAQLILHAYNGYQSSLGAPCPLPKLRMHHLLRRSQLLPLESSKPRQRDPEFLAYLAAARIRQERREIELLTQPVGRSSSIMASIAPDASSTTSSTYSPFASSSRDIGQGLNILTLMATGFAVFYYAGSLLYPHSRLGPVLCGLFGLIGALVLEVTLLLIRETRKEGFELAQQRDKTRVSQSEHVSKQRLKAKEASMKAYLDSLSVKLPT